MVVKRFYSIFVPRKRRLLALCLLICVLCLSVVRFWMLMDAPLISYVKKTDVKESLPKQYLCTDFVGGLGNHLFQYAGIYGISRLKDYRVFVAKDNRLNKKFALSAEIRNNTKECKNFTSIVEKHFCAFSENMLQLNSSLSYRLGHYFQSWKYFQHVEDEIRREFTFSSDIQQKAREQFKKILEKRKIKTPSKTTFVGVHVRRGDISSKKQFLKYGYLVPEKKYFIKAFQIMLKTFKNVLFIVSSNDQEWVKKHLLTEQHVTMIADKNSAEVDMAILTMCNHTIMSVGSFGWWAGFLADGLTIYYRYPAKEGSNLRKTFSNEMFDYYYPGWMGLE